MAERYMIGGFSFRDERAAEQARKEIEAIKYIKSKVDIEKPEMMLEIYHKVIAEHLFETPVGICFLKELQETLMMNPRTRGEVIETIPVDGFYIETKKKETENQTKNQKVTTQVRVREKHINYKSRYGLLLTASIVLLVMVIAMFAITMTSNSPNILNYENQIINKYEEWEKQLEQREEELKKREQEPGGNEIGMNQSGAGESGIVPLSKHSFFIFV